MTSHSLLRVCQRSYPAHCKGLNGPPGQLYDDLTVDDRCDALSIIATVVPSSAQRGCLAVKETPSARHAGKYLMIPQLS